MLHTELKAKGHCLRLTRSFYPKDEVEISLLMSIIKKEPCETCLFWACELLYSGFDIAPLLWSLYYDFYAQLNPGLFGRIATALKKLRDGDVEPVLMVIKTLRVKKATDNVFSLRISQTPTKFTIYRGRTPTWLAGYPAEQRPLLRAICNYDWNQIMLYINRRIGEPKELLKSVIKVMTEKQIVNAKDCSLETDDIVESEWNNHGYEDEFHIVLSLIVSLITPDDQIDFNKKLIKLNDSEKKYVAHLTSWDKDHDGNSNGSESHVWKRLHQIDKDVNAFDTVWSRMMAAAGATTEAGRVFSKELADNWPFHCSETPYWNAVLAKYGVTAKCADMKGHGCELTFAEGNMGCEEDLEEKFEKHYGYLCELDEPYMAATWDWLRGDLSSTDDVIDVMDEIFGVEDLRMELDGLEVSVSNAKSVYGTRGEPRNDMFDFTAINKLLDSI